MTFTVSFRIVALSVILLTSAKAESCVKNSPLTCTNCTHVEFCDPWVLETAFINCDLLTKGSKVFCNAGDCSATPMSQCVLNRAEVTAAPQPIASREFRCTTTGLVPDPINCRQYYNCQQSNGPAELRACPTNTVYNANTRTCEEFAKCLTVDCNAADRLILAYGPNTPFYVFCDRDLVTDERFPIVLRCPNNRIYDGVLQECIEPLPPAEIGPPMVDPTHPYSFFCNSADIYPDPLNCTRFYKCPGLALTAVAYTCPTPSRFNARTGNCELDIACHVVDCAAAGKYVVAYDMDSSYYLFCDFNIDRYVPNIFRCPDAGTFNENTVTCDAPVTDPPPPASGFTCTSIGSFPDPYNCHVYHVCTAANIPSLRYECQPNFFYSISTETCLRQIFVEQCVTIDCSGNAAPLQVFEPHLRYYADCRTDPLAVYKCPNGNLLNVKSGICE